MQKIFKLNPTVRFDDQLVYVEGTRWETTLCPLNAGLPSQHSMRRLQPNPIKAIGPVVRMTDFEWTVYKDILLEEDIVRRLQSAGFSGCEFRPAELYTTTETPIGRQVFHLRVTGWGGKAPPASGIRVVEECPHCKRQVFSGFTDPNELFSIDDWDGSDFFMIWPMPKYIFVTSEVVNWIAKSEFSGVRAEPLDQIRKPILGTGFSPGHLHDWFDDERLAEIMSSLKQNE